LTSYFKWNIKTVNFSEKKTHKSCFLCKKQFLVMGMLDAERIICYARPQVWQFVIFCGNLFFEIFFCHTFVAFSLFQKNFATHLCENFIRRNAVEN